MKTKETFKDKLEWIYIKEKDISITKNQMFNNFAYEDILKEVKEEEIADYNLLQWLRNNKKYQKHFLKFWVYVPNPDEISRKKYVARFYVDSDWADLDCYRNPAGSDSPLGVFLVRKGK